MNLSSKSTEDESKGPQQQVNYINDIDVEDEIRRITEPEEESLHINVVGEDEAQEIMEFAGEAILNDTTARMSDDEDDDLLKSNLAREEEDNSTINMRDIAIMHMAKKNLSFELEYIQLVCQALEQDGTKQFQEIKKKIEENPLLALGGKEESKGVRFAEVEEKKKPQKVDEATKKLRTYLENTYNKLNQMKKEILRDDQQFTREEMKKHLTTMACFLERTRLYLDNFIYPRDLSLNLIDVQIEESSVVDKKRQMHLTERLYTIVYKDFFTAYERAVQFHNKIQKFIGKDISDHEQLMLSHSSTLQINVALDNDILENDRESIQIASTDLDANKLGKDAEDAKKHISRKDGTVASDMRSMIKILQGFNPAFPPITSVDEILDTEFTFCLRFKTTLSLNTELQMALFEENSRAFSMTTVYDHQISINQKNDSCFFFVNIPMRAIIMGNLALIIKVIEKKPSRNHSISLSVLGQDDQPSTNKVYRGFSILPISKLFWIQQLKVKQIYAIQEAQIYKPLTPLLIEDKYSTLIEKRGFKKYKDVALTQQFNLSYTYRLEPKLKEEAILKKPNSTIVRRADFDTNMLYSKDSTDSQQASEYKQKVEKYRFNDLQIELNSVVLTENLLKKSPIMRIEVTLRDNFGMIYDTVYKTISDGSFNFSQTYESFIYPLETSDFRISETFFVRIPTKSLDTLKKIYIIFQLQTLVNLKDAKGNKYKSSNIQSDLENLQFRTEMVTVLPLYDQNEKCILKNRRYPLQLLQIEDFKKPIPTKWENFRQIPGVSNLRPCTDQIIVNVKLISNEFTHNTYINNLLLLKETSLHEQEVDIILKELKKLKDSNDQLLFHDKILDKLFQLMSTNKDGELAELIFETIIMMIDLFQSRYTDYKEVLENYIQKHFAQPKAYLALLQQILIVSENIKEGLVESAQNEQKNGYVLMTMKYMGIILKIVRNSYIEALQCQETAQDEQSTKFDHSQKAMPLSYNNPKLEMYKKNMIEEENEEDSDEEGVDAFTKNAQRASRNRKTAIRKTMTGNPTVEPVQTYEAPRDLSKRQFGAQIQEILGNIFQGCHKDAMKTTLSLRAILYENISQIFEHITDFMDDQFLQSILHYVYEEQQVQLLGITSTTGGSKDAKSNDKSKLGASFNPSSKPTPGGILKKTQPQEESKNKANNKNTRRSEMQSVGGQMIMLDLNFFENEANVKALQDYNWINEEAITKIKIIAMGRLLLNKVFDKVQGDTNKVIMAFCHNVEKYHIKRNELSLHVLYFLYCLFQYVKSPDEFSEIEGEQPQSGIKLKIFSKRYLDLREFFAKILPEISNQLKNLLKDANIEDRVKEQKFPDDALKPFNEKSSLILLSMLNTITQDKFQYIIFNDHKKLLAVVKNLKKLSNKLAFQEPYCIFFEKKKVQVIRKIIMYIINIFMTKEPDQIPADYHQIIHQCRLMMIYLWNKLAKINQDYKKTTRARSLVKDQLKVYKGKMLEQYRIFWHKFKQLGQPWIAIKNSLSKQFQNFIKLTGEKAIQLYMEVVNDTLIFEYKETRDIKNTSSSIFKVYYDLNMTNGRDHTAIRFYDTFEKIMSEKNQLFQQDAEFQKKIRERFQQMKQLSEAIVNVNYSKEHLKENTFYRAYCMAQLIEVLWELKLFPLFMENQTQFESLNKNLENNLENAYTALRFVESLDHQTEDDRTKIGQREIVARIQLNSLKRVESFFTKAEFYEKAIEILNKQKDIAESTLFDYNMVSTIVKSQYKIYRKLAEDQDRHFAIYFKVGFFGQSFPEMFRNKEFIYRGRKLMKRSDVKDRFLKYFPEAYMLEHSNFPDKATLTAEKKSIQIQKVDPMTYMELKDFGMAEKTKDQEELEIGKKAKDLPQKLRAYYLENFKNKFYKQTMLDSKNDDELQKDRLIEIFKVKSKFPTVYNMQEIIKVKKFVRHAIDEAVRNVQMIIDQIEQLKKTATSTEDPSDFEFLTSQIRAALESPIQGGIEKFINTFITEANLKGNQREKTLALFTKIEECDQSIYYGIQAIQSFTNNETMFNKINGDYMNFREKITKLRQYIDGKII